MSQPFLPGLSPGLAARLGGLLGNPILGQIFVWQVLQQITAAVLGPEMQGIQEEMFRLNPSLQLTPADVVEAYVKGHLTREEAKTEASLSGIKDERLQTLIETAGEPIPLLLAAEAWRRGIIPKSSPDPSAVSLEKAIRDSRLKNAWIPVVEAMQFELPPIGTIIEGWLRAQITETQALELAYKRGVDEATARLM